jgi:malate dehydrogenase (oxaloacetate-decarboxylating)(NADP+)
MRLRVRAVVTNDAPCSTIIDLFVKRMPDVPDDGEMRRDAALSEDLRGTLLPNSTLTGGACVLKMAGGQGVAVGPILLGVKSPVHILTPSATVRRVVKMAALAVASAGVKGAGAIAARQHAG